VKRDTVTVDLIALPEGHEQPDGADEPQVAHASTAFAVGDNVIRFCDAERRALLRALEACGWRISGHGGAADLLGLKPTTMHAKMKKLGIGRPSATRESAAARPATAR
jgi:transcriptional regulator of acetoin/glycerol metabolism